MSSGVQYLDLGDYLVIAGAALEVEAEALAHQCDLHLADSALNAPRAGFGGVEMMVGVASGAVSATALADWVRERIDPA